MTDATKGTQKAEEKGGQIPPIVRDAVGRPLVVIVPYGEYVRLMDAALRAEMTEMKGILHDAEPIEDMEFPDPCAGMTPRQRHEETMRLVQEALDSVKRGEFASTDDPREIARRFDVQHGL